MSTRTKPIRVPVHVGDEVHTAAQVMGATSAELLEQAWSFYKESPDFKGAFLSYQQAFASGDLEHVAAALNSRARQRAEARALAANE